MTANSKAGGSGDADSRLVRIFADESCLGNQFKERKNPGGAAGMIEHFTAPRGWRRRDFAVFDPDTTNNRMALVSGIAALGEIRPGFPLVFTSDSRYLITGMKKWVHAWARRGWRRKGGPIENLELWRELCRVAARHQVEWRWTKGHADDMKNAYAHWLATKTARERRGIKGLAPSGFESWLAGQTRDADFEEGPPREIFRPDPPPPRGC